MADRPRLLLCLATAKGLGALDALAAVEEPARHLICTFRETDTAGESDQEILRRARDLGCRVLLWEEIRHNLLGFVTEHGLDGVVAVGWRYLLPIEINRHARHGLVVFHDSLLPRHRGFAPLATAILCGDTEAGVTVLHAARELDAGDILWQERVPILPRDHIADLIARVQPVYAQLLARLLRAVDAGETLPRLQQDHSRATYSIWRGPEDARIDWTRPAGWIDRLIRSAGYPYQGAWTSLDGHRVTIDAAHPVDDVHFSLREPGKVWRIEDECPVIVCGEGMLKITAAREGGDRPHLPARRLRVRYT